MYKAIIAYDGTRYFGWQKTKEGPSIQDQMQKAIQQLTGEACVVEAASRTDRGVHAEGQVIQWSLERVWLEACLPKALNALLPKDIRVIAVEKKAFHPTLECIGKEYRYRVVTGHTYDPISRHYAWHVPHELDRQKIEGAIQELVGTHDFSAFANEREKNPICHLEAILFDGSLFTIRGDRFLYKMVRNLIGSLVAIGRGKPLSAGQILASKDRLQAGMTAPAHGLYLHQVFYPLKSLS